MIFYNPVFNFLFSDYGIDIPVMDDRAQKVFNEYKKCNLKALYFDPNLVPKITIDDLLLAHDLDFVERLFGNYPELLKEMMICFELIDEVGKYHRYNPKNAKYDFIHARNKILLQAGMTYYSTKHALNFGFSYFLGGGGHHAMSFSGRGFCLINDIVIALRKCQKENLIKTAWVIDVDAHKGDGTAEITADDLSIITLSIHMKKGWPLETYDKKAPWFIPSNIDIEIDEQEEDQYLPKLKNGLEQLSLNFIKPDLAIIVNGADPYELDQLPSTQKLKLTKADLLKRDILVYQFLKEKNIPQSYVMAGGYGQHSFEIYSQFLQFVGESSPKGTEISFR